MSGEPLRIWVQSRGTLPFPVMKTSIIVQEQTLVDDLKALVKKELSPLLDHVPKPAITFYAYNHVSDDYLIQNVVRRVTENPMPEHWSDAPGTKADDPLFFDFDTKLVKDA
eukprot:EG_transcript_36326